MLPAGGHSTKDRSFSSCSGDSQTLTPSRQQGNSHTTPLLRECEDEEHRDDGPVNEPDMMTIEAQQCVKLTHGLQQLHPQELNLRRKPVALALSGGGTRAAAFHCGVLWALADAGLMKDVVHLSATSGGGYTAASLMTHLYQMSSEAESAKSLDDWYKQVVMRTVLRMQHNLDYLVCTSLSRLLRLPRADLPEEVGTSCFPRILDLPMLVFALVGSLCSSPLMLIVHTVWPIVLLIETYHGSLLKSVWCDPTASPWSNAEWIAWTWHCAGTVAVFSAVSIALNVLHGLGCSPCGQRSPKKFLACRSLRQMASRFAVLFAVYALLVQLVLWLQVREWRSAGPEVAPPEQAFVRTLCRGYIAGVPGADTVPAGPICTDLQVESTWWGSIDGATWFDAGGNALYLNESWADVYSQLPQQPRGLGLPMHVKRTGPLWGHTVYVTLGLSGIVIVAVVVILMGPLLLKWAFTAAIPLLYLLLTASVARWKIFGPITGQLLLPGVDASGFTPTLCYILYASCLVCAILTLPVYDVVLKFKHLFYRRALRKAFFCGGRDVSAAAITTSPYCPILLLGACLHDFRRLGEDSNFCDFMISSFFLGCRRTGFFFTPSQARLAHLMTVAGAAIDASLLISLDILLIRLLLSVLSLRFGDFLRLEPDGDTAVRVGEKLKGGAVRVGNAVWKRFNKKGGMKIRKLQRFISEEHDAHWMQRWLQGLLNRIPAACPFILCQVFLLFGVLNSRSPPSKDSCHTFFLAMKGAFYLLLLIVVLSFFAYFKPLKWLMRSPLIQQFQMMVMHVYVAPSPPPYLYVSDGGLLEVLGILPLLRRRLKTIVVSDAAEDPLLTMRCLRDAAMIARKEHLCSFFDPLDPRRDLEFVLQDLPHSNKAWLHLGIRYEPPAEATAGVARQELEVGHLYYVRMRLLPEDAAPVRSLLTERELLGPPPASGLSQPEPRAGPRSSMGGTCKPWCECGGLMAGRKFPHYNMSNQFLTPIHFANLCGLGAELCHPLMEEMRK